MSLAQNLISCLAGFIGMVFGFMHFSRKGYGLYFKMVVLGVGCQMLGHLFFAVQTLCGNGRTDVFQVGMLSIAGCFLYLFSANYGLMDGLADDRGKGLRKYRLIALAAPLTMFVCYLPAALSESRGLSLKIGDAVIMLFLMGASYYNLKHLIISDVCGGFVKCMRPYNLSALMLAFLSVAETTLGTYGCGGLQFVFGMLMSAVLLMIVPVMSRGVEKWIM